MQVELGDGVVVMQKVFTTPLEQLFTLMWDNNADLFMRFHNLRKDTSTFEIVGWDPDCGRGRGPGRGKGKGKGRGQRAALFPILASIRDPVHARVSVPVPVHGKVAAYQHSGGLWPARTLLQTLM